MYKGTLAQAYQSGVNDTVEPLHAISHIERRRATQPIGVLPSATIDDLREEYDQGLLVDKEVRKLVEAQSAAISGHRVQRDLDGGDITRLKDALKQSAWGHGHTAKQYGLLLASYNTLAASVNTTDGMPSGKRQKLADETLKEDCAWLKADARMYEKQHVVDQVQAEEMKQQIEGLKLQVRAHRKGKEELRVKLEGKEDREAELQERVKNLEEALAVARKQTKEQREEKDSIIRQLGQ